MSQKSYTIGELARRSGVSTRKIRFYADAGLLSPGRSAARYRVFEDRDLVVLDLIGALRQAGASLAEIRAVLATDTTLAELLTVRLAEVEASIQRQKALAATLRLALAAGAPTPDDIRRISQMIGHSETQRRETAHAYLDLVTEGVTADPGWRGRMEELIAAPGLPEAPSPQQLDAWLNLNALLADAGLQRMLRAQAIDTGRTAGFLRVRDETEAWRIREHAIMDAARQAMRRGVSIESDEGQKMADAYLDFMAWNRGVPDDADFREGMRDIWADHALIELFWKEVAVLNGEEHVASPEYQWLAAAVERRLAS